MPELQEKMKAERIAQDNEQKSLQVVIDTLQTDIQSMQEAVRELQQENAALKSRQQHQQVEEVLVLRH